MGKFLDRSYSTPTPQFGTEHIKLGHGKYAIIDVVSYVLVADFSWTFDNGYALTKIILPDGRKTSCRMHQMIRPGFEDVDHIDHNGLNNRLSNLRGCQHRQNMRNMNKHKDNKTGIKGVGFDSDRNKYAARITADDKVIHLGRFDTIEDAAKAYDAAAKELHGEFARLNFP